MRNFIYLIGTSDDFESIEDLKAEYFAEPITRNMSVYPVEIDPACRIRGYDTIEEIATMIARGEAMTDDWCLNGTLSCLLET